MVMTVMVMMSTACVLNVAMLLAAIFSDFFKFKRCKIGRAHV